MTDQFSRGVTAGVENRGNLALALVAGIVAALLGAAIWMAVDVFLDLHSALVAILIGLMIGYAIRLAGHGGSPVFGIIGAVLTLASCLGGSILAVLYRQVSPQHDFYSVATSTDYVQLVTLIFTHMGVIDYLIYAIALYEGYKFSIRK